MNQKQPAKCCRCGSYLTIDPTQSYTKCTVCGTVDETPNLLNAFFLEYVPRNKTDDSSDQEEAIRRLECVEKKLETLEEVISTLTDMIAQLSSHVCQLSEQIHLSREAEQVFTEAPEAASSEEAEQIFTEAPEAASSEETEQVFTEAPKAAFSEETEQVFTEAPEAASSEETEQVFTEAPEAAFSEETEQVFTEAPEAALSEETEQVFTEDPEAALSEETEQVFTEAPEAAFSEEAKQLSETPKTPAFYRDYLPSEHPEPQSSEEEALPSSDREVKGQQLKEVMDFLMSDAVMEEQLSPDIPQPVSLYDVPREQWSELESFYIPGDFVCEEAMFMDFTNLRKVVIGEGVKAISPRMFENCTGLSEISFPEGLYAVFSAAFHGCTSLTVLSFPSSLHQIGKLAFAGCTALKKVRLSSCVDIGVQAFCNCTALEMVACQDVTLPEHVYFDKLYHPNRVHRLNAILRLVESTYDFREYMLIRNDYPDLFTFQEDYLPAEFTENSIHFSSGCFRNCTSLFEVDIPLGTTHIDDDAFRDCGSLLYLHVPPTVAILDGAAVVGCPNAKAYYYDIEIPVV